jgi:hypothetical protein
VRVISWVIYYGHHHILQCIIHRAEQLNRIGDLYKRTSKSEDVILKKISNAISNRRRMRIEKCRLLLLSCWSGDVETVRVLVPLCKEVINEIDHICVLKDVHWYAFCFNSLLVTVCKGGYVNVVEELVKSRADVNLQDRWGYTPLIAACKGGHVSVVEELVKAGADINLQDISRNTALTAACEGGHVSVVEELIKAGADVNQQDRKGNTPLIATVTKGSLSTVRCLVEHGAYIGTGVADITVSAVYRTLLLVKPDILKYFIKEQNKTIPGKNLGNSHLFNCLVYIRHTGVTTDSRDNVVVTDRSKSCMDRWGDWWWETISEGDCDVLRRLLYLGLAVNQSIQWKYESDVRPLLFALIDDKFVKHRTEKVRLLLEAGVSVRLKYSEYVPQLSWRSVLDWVRDKLHGMDSRVRYQKCNSVLDRGVSVIERTGQLVCEYSKDRYDREYKALEYKRVMYEIKKHVISYYGVQE